MAPVEDFTPQEFHDRFRETLASILVPPLVTPQDSPNAVILGGQSGAGKSLLHVIFKEKYAGNVIVINGDEYRKSHPRFKEIDARYGIDSPAHTSAWSNKMVETLIEELSSEGYNLIIEGTLRTAAVPLQTARLLRAKGYAVSLALMAVKPEISLVSCQIRYERMRIAGTTPRAVDPDHHRRIVDDIVGNLAQLEASDAFESVSLYNRAGVCLCASKCPAPDAPASAVLRDVLFGAWTEEEQAHLHALQEEYESLKNATG